MSLTPSLIVTSPVPLGNALVATVPRSTMSPSWKFSMWAWNDPLVSTPAPRRTRPCAFSKMTVWSDPTDPPWKTKSSPFVSSKVPDPLTDPPPMNANAFVGDPANPRWR